jgi:hypothetical protein
MVGTWFHLQTHSNDGHNLVFFCMRTFPWFDNLYSHISRLRWQRYSIDNTYIILSNYFLST